MARRKPEGNETVESSAPHANGSSAAIEHPSSQPEEDRTNYPVHVVRFGTVRACIWQAQTDMGIRHNVTVSRLYKGADGAWYSATTFSYRDLLPLAKALDWAHTWIAQEIAGSGNDVPF